MTGKLKPLSLREKQLVSVLDQTIEAILALDEMLTTVPPTTFELHQFKVWEEARLIAQHARDLHLLLTQHTEKTS